MRIIWLGLLVCASLFGQGNVEPILECVDTVTRMGTSRVAAPFTAGGSVMSFTQPLPLGVNVVLNPGAANQETIQVGQWRTSTPPYQGDVTAGSLNSAFAPLAFAHADGELVAVESQESSAYFGFFNLLSTTVEIAAGSDNNRLIPGNPDQGQPSAFPPGVFRNVFGAPVHSPRPQIWALDSSHRTANRDPALACRYSGPQVRAEPVPVALGASTAGLRLGTVTGGSPGPLTVRVTRVYRHSPSANVAPTITTDVQFSNLRVQNGVIFGDVLTTAGTLYRHYFFILSVTDSTGQGGLSTAVVDLVNPCPMTVTPPLLQNAYVNTPYSVNFSATGVQGPITFAMEGTVPAGLSLTSTGLLSGTPEQTGTFPVTLRSTGGDSCFQRTPLSLEV